MSRILIADDKESMAKMLSLTLQAEGYETLIAKNGEDAIKAVNSIDIDLVVTDLKMPGKSGLEVLEEVKKKDNTIPVILMTAYGSINTAVKAVKQGAYDFLPKPFDPDHLLLLISRALEKQKLVSENLLLKEELSKNNKLPRIIGKSASFLASVEQIRKVAAGNATVLLEGESGTGKEIFARTIHLLSSRNKHPLIPINCAAIPKGLMESELFGHEKGAFTGAQSMRVGKFELANGGTIFLDEIGDMDIGLQAKLLRILEEHEVVRVGGVTNVKIDVRVVTATNKNLKTLVEQGAFREDLYFRLNVIPIRIPPLRERREDIRPLAEHFLTSYALEAGKNNLSITEDALKLMYAHDWPGNIRELKNMMERAVIFCNGNRIEADDLGLSPVSPDDSDLSQICFEGALQNVVSAVVRTVEKKMIGKVLKETGWNKSKAAVILQISYKTLLTKIKEYFGQP